MNHSYHYKTMNGVEYYGDPAPQDVYYAMVDAWYGPVTVYSSTCYHSFHLRTYWTKDGDKCDLEEYDNNLDLVYKNTLDIIPAMDYIKERL